MVNGDSDKKSELIVLKPQTNTLMDEQLHQAYLNTNYTVFNPSITIKIGENNAELDRLLLSNNATEWAYITPFNPFSKVLSEEENNQRFEELKNKITAYLFFEGEGVGTDSTWRPEKSLLIIGITKDKAIDIGKEYEQNTIVLGNINHPAELILLAHF